MLISLYIYTHGQQGELEEHKILNCNRIVENINMLLKCNSCKNHKFAFSFNEDEWNLSAQTISSSSFEVTGWNTMKVGGCIVAYDVCIYTGKRRSVNDTIDCTTVKGGPP